MFHNIVLLGDGGVGKTTWVNRLLGDPFEPRYFETRCVSYNTIEKDGVMFKIWDTAGQEKYSDLGSKIYHLASLGIIFYDMSNKVSYKNVDAWVTKFRQACPTAPIMIIGTKLDIPKITGEEHRKLMRYTDDLFMLSNKECCYFKTPLNKAVDMFKNKV